MPSPAGYTEWGYLGGLIFTVVAFLTYLWRRDAASAKRERAQQDFFSGLYKDGREATEDLTRAIRELLEKFHQHDEMTSNAIAKMDERTKPARRKTGGAD